MAQTQDRQLTRTGLPPSPLQISRWPLCCTPAACSSQVRRRSSSARYALNRAW